jgi:hypothetical protein
MTDALPVPGRAATRQQLAEMRSRLVGNLGKQIEGGDLALLAAVTGALAAMDAEPDCPADAEHMARAIVTDVPERPVCLSLYGEDGRVATIDLPPLRVLAIAQELIAAAGRRLR